MNPQREIRTFDGIELRAATKGNGPGTLVGYAAVFGTLSEDFGCFVETIRTGAFTKSLGSDVVALFDHSSSYVLGRTKAGTLRLAQDDRGLKVEIDLPDTTAGRDVAASVGRGDLRGMSFGFVAEVDQWDFTGQTPIRTLIEVRLVEVSVVAWPAYPDTTIAVRSLDKARATPPPSAPEPAPAPTSTTPDLSAALARLRVAESD